MPAFITTISSVPPCSAEMFGASPPSTPPGNRLTLILPPLFAADDLGELLHAHHDRMALRVLRRELDRALLDVLRERLVRLPSARRGSGCDEHGAASEAMGHSNLLQSGVQPGSQHAGTVTSEGTQGGAVNVLTSPFNEVGFTLMTT